MIILKNQLLKEVLEFEILLINFIKILILLKR